jgi:hypothetical protein
MKTSITVSALSLALAVFAVSSCGGLKMSGVGRAASSDAHGATSAGPAQPSGDPREDLKKAFTAQFAAKSFRYRLEFSASKGKAEAEFVAPDRYHITMTGQSPMPGRDARPEVIIIGGDVFMKIGNMPWQKSGAGGGETTLATTIARMAQQFRATDVEQAMAKYEEVKLAGPDVLDGSPAFVYQFRLKGAQAPTTGKIWIGAGDGLPRKIEQEGGAPPNPGGDAGRNRLTATYYDYNADIRIEPPI